MVPLTEPFELLRIAHSPNVHIEPIEDEEAIVISSKENGFIEFNVLVFYFIPFQGYVTLK